MALYDTIGTAYSSARRADPRIAAAIAAQLAGSRTVLNVGAGTGSYEPSDRFTVAAEVSLAMIRQRHPAAAPAIQATALCLPFADRSFDATLAVLTIHHWGDWSAGICEMKRVARQRVVILTWDPNSFEFWLVERYFPDFLEMDRGRCPAIDELRAVLGNVSVIPVPVPHDCVDGFLGAYWRRPEAYLDAGVRSGISSFQKTSNSVEGPLARLRDDLESGAWDREYGHLRNLSELDMGYRIVVADI